MSILFIIGNLIILCGLDARYLGVDVLYHIVEPNIDIFTIISIIVSIYVLGYCISILKKSIEKSDEMPDFNIKNDFINGLKHIIISFVYLIIPILIFFGLAYLMNVTNYAFDLQTFSFMKLTFNETANYIETSMQTATPTLNVIITLIISFIIFLIFAILEIIGLCRLAKTDSLKEVFNFKAISEEFKESSIRLLIGIIIVCIISIVLGMIFSIFKSVPNN